MRKLNYFFEKSKFNVPNFAKIGLQLRSVALYLEHKMHPDLIAKILNCSIRTIYNWLNIFQKNGVDGFSLERSPRKTKLNDEQNNEIINIVLTKTPIDFGFDTALWTRQLISNLISRKFSILLHETSVGRLLKKFKISPQKPIRKAYQQNKQEVAHFCEEVFPSLVEQANKEKAIIMFLDETTAVSDPNIGTTWGRKGITPIIPGNGKKQKINVMGTLDQNGQSNFMVYQGNTDSKVLMAYIDEFSKGFKKKIYIILDNARYHKSEELEDHMHKKHKGWVELVYLPAYSPELNPSELLWAHLKSHGLNRVITKNAIEFGNAVNKSLALLMNNPLLGMAMFGKKELAYIGKSLEALGKVTT